MSPDAPSSSRRAAVIDVGSNSVRMVMYRLDGRAIWTVFNEKALAGLGRDMPQTGRLPKDGVEMALAALRRFRALLDGWDETEVQTAATAAVREAEDGPEFVETVYRQTGLRLRVLTGEEEARYGALGVLAGAPDAEGVVGDLGGSSLELTRIGGGAPGEGISLPLGPFALGAPAPLSPERARDAIVRALKPYCERFATPTFHAVGGGWRNLALLHMAMTKYPLHVAHHYELSRVGALAAARFICSQSPSSLARTEGISRKRADTLPYAALVLETLIERLGFERIVVSAYGVREGLLLDAMSPIDRSRDPLIEGFESLTQQRGLADGFGAALAAWLSPAFRRLPPLFGAHEPVLTQAACRLADIGARYHPDHRADLVFEQVLRAPIAGMSHPERAFLAIVAFARHTAAATFPERDIVERLLSPEARDRARALGAAIRLGCDLSGRNPAILQRARLGWKGERLELTADEMWADLLAGEQTAKRLATLNELVKKTLKASGTLDAA